MENIKTRHGFTLMETMIIVTIIAILAIGILFLNSRRPIFKSHDAVKKSDLNRIRIALEDYYEDHQCYPNASDLNSILSSCDYDPPAFFHSYITKVPCTPDTRQPYFGYVEAGSLCPQRYAIYTYLTNKTDPVIAEEGCTNGCGPGSSYNYGISSPNITAAQVYTPDQPFFYCPSNSDTPNCNRWVPSTDGPGRCPPGAAWATIDCAPNLNCKYPAPICDPKP